MFLKNNKIINIIIGILLIFVGISGFFVMTPYPNFWLLNRLSLFYLIISGGYLIYKAII